MTILRPESPTCCRIENPGDLTELKSHLQYRDRKVDFELKKMKHSFWYIQKHGQEAYDERMETLKKERVKSLLFEDEHGYWTYSGLIKPLARNLKASIAEPRFSRPAAQLLPWKDKPEHVPHPYQDQSLEALLAEGHAGVEIGTGLGKSLIIFHLVKRLGLQTVVMAPNVSIARQLYEGEGGTGGLKAAFGSRYVGLYGDGRKDASKLITVAIAASLTKVEPGSPAWKFFTQSHVFVADESHLCPASTLAKVCFGLLAKAPYRFFFSATQLRNDGLDMLLDAITGPIVYRKSVMEGINDGYLARLKTTFCKVSSKSTFSSRDANEMTRKHLFYNPAVNRIAGAFANNFVSQGRQVLVLVEELKQFTHLLPYFKHVAAFAHAGDTQGVLPEPYRDPDAAAWVKQFNAGKLPILVGTSCIATGTDIKANQATIYLRGGASEIEVMQGAVGRSTRLHKPVNKTSCDIIDFDVHDVEVLHRHALIRKNYFGSVGPVLEWSL